MTRPLTYPPEILIESSVDLLPEFGNEGVNDASCELIAFLVEFATELLSSL
jgi:hypothetical protein